MNDLAISVVTVAAGVILAGALMYALKDVAAIDYARNGFDT